MNSPPLANLTHRQVEILRLVSLGEAAPRNASELGISLATVRSHLQALRELLGCRSTPELGEFWREHAYEWAEMQRQLGEPWVSLREQARRGHSS